MTEYRSEKRVALVTGSTSGIGMAIAKRLAEDGFSIAFHSKSSVMAGEALAETHPGASYSQADLCDQKQIRSLVAEVLTHHGRLDLLVNNAGISATIPHTSLKEASAQIWRDLYEVNVIAPGLVETPMSRNWTEAQKLWKERSPMGRGAQPEDIAQVASMLVASHYITGEIVISDGGLNLT